MTRVKWLKRSFFAPIIAIGLVFLLTSTSLPVKAEGSGNPFDYHIVVGEDVVADADLLVALFPDYVRYNEVDDRYEVQTGESVLVQGTLVFSDVTFLMDDEIVVTGEIAAERSTFGPLSGGQWDGISINDGVGNFYQCTFNDAIVGVSGFIAELNVAECDFVNCDKGVYVEKSTNVNVIQNQFSDCGISVELNDNPLDSPITKPDLAVVVETSSAQPLQGDDVTVTITITNHGKTAENVVTELDISTEASTITYNDPTIIAGRTIIHTYAYSTTGQTGTVDFDVIVDPLDAIDEELELNNDATTSIDIVSPPTVSLTINEPSTPTYTGEEVDFVVDFSDVDGYVDTVNIDFGDGNSDSFDSGELDTTHTFSHTYSYYGPYTVSVTAIDDDAQEDDATGSLTIHNRAPIADSITVTPPVPFGPGLFTFTGAGTDPEGQPLQFKWMISGDVNEYGSTPDPFTYNIASAGTYTVTMWAVDDGDLVSSNSIMETIDLSGSPPVIVADIFISGTENYPGIHELGIELYFTSESYDPDGTQVTHLWELGDGQTRTTDNFYYTYTEANTYAPKLTVTDENNEQTVFIFEPFTLVAPPTEIDIEVVGFKQEPIVIDEGMDLIFNAIIPSEIEYTHVQWDFDYTEGFDVEASGVTVGKVFFFAGIFVVRMEVYNDFDLIGYGTVTIEVQEPPIIVDATAEYIDVAALCAVDFTGTVSDATDITTYQWDFNGDLIIDWSSPSNTNVPWVFPEVVTMTTFTATFSVIDSSLNTFSDSIDINVYPSIMVSGTVTDGQDGLIGVSVVFELGDIMIETDTVSGGYYEANLPLEGQYFMNVDFIGYIPQSIDLGVLFYDDSIVQNIVLLSDIDAQITVNGLTGEIELPDGFPLPFQFAASAALPEGDSVTSYIFHLGEITHTENVGDPDFDGLFEYTYIDNINILYNVHCEILTQQGRALNTNIVQIIFGEGSVEGPRESRAPSARHDVIFHLETDNGIPIEDARIKAFNDQGRGRGRDRTDVNGDAHLTLKDDQYTFRIMYMGYEFWTDEFLVLSDMTIDWQLPHTDYVVNVVAGPCGLEDVLVRSYTSAGRNLRYTMRTDENGQAVFSLPAGEEYQFMTRMAGDRYWSDITTGDPVTITVSTIPIDVTVTAGESVDGLTVGAYTRLDSFTGISGTTDVTGIVSLDVPDRRFNYKTDYLGYQFESGLTSGDAFIDIASSARTVTLTVGGVIGGDYIVYVNNEDNEYSGLSRMTSTGTVDFNLPTGYGYIFSVVVGEETFESTLNTGGAASIDITGGTYTVNAKFDGEFITDSITIGAYKDGVLEDAVTTTTGVAEFDLPSDTYEFSFSYVGHTWTTGETTNLINTIDIPARDLLITVSSGTYDLEGVYLELVKSAPDHSSIKLLDATDANGESTATIPSGVSYAILYTYLGIDYYHEVFPGDTTADIVIPLREVTVTVTAGVALDNVWVEVFDDDGTTGMTEQTVSGQVTFDLPPGLSFTYKTTYYDTTYEVSTSADTATIDIPVQDVDVTVTADTTQLLDHEVRVLYDGSYTLSPVDTDPTTGIATFQNLPEGVAFEFEATYLYEDYTSGTYTIPTGTSGTTNVQIDFTDVTITVLFDGNGIDDLDVFVLTSGGVLLSEISADTTENGGDAEFRLPSGVSYKYQTTYLNYQHTSAAISGDGDFEIPSGTINAQVYDMTGPFVGSIYLYSWDSGTSTATDTGATYTTDAAGQVSFACPSGFDYKLEMISAYDSTSFFSDAFTVTEDGSTDVTFGRLADVKVENVVITPELVQQDGEVLIEFDVTNDGNAPVVDLVVDIYDNYASNVIASLTITTLAVGATQSFDETWNVPGCNEEHNVLVEVDPDDDVPEYDETNNVGSAIVQTMGLKVYQNTITGGDIGIKVVDTSTEIGANTIQDTLVSGIILEAVKTDPFWANILGNEIINCPTGINSLGYPSVDLTGNRITKADYGIFANNVITGDLDVSSNLLSNVATGFHIENNAVVILENQMETSLIAVELIGSSGSVSSNAISMVSGTGFDLLNSNIDLVENSLQKVTGTFEDTFDDESKIASKEDVSVTNGLVTLSAGTSFIEKYDPVQPGWLFDSDFKNSIDECILYDQLFDQSDSEYDLVLGFDEHQTDHFINTEKRITEGRLDQKFDTIFAAEMNHMMFIPPPAPEQKPLIRNEVRFIIQGIEQSYEIVYSFVPYSDSIYVHPVAFPEGLLLEPIIDPMLAEPGFDTMVDDDTNTLYYFSNIHPSSTTQVVTISTDDLANWLSGKMNWCNVPTEFEGDEWTFDMKHDLEITHLVPVVGGRAYEVNGMALISDFITFGTPYALAGHLITEELEILGTQKWTDLNIEFHREGDYDILLTILDETGDGIVGYSNKVLQETLDLSLLSSFNKIQLRFDFFSDEMGTTTPILFGYDLSYTNTDPLTAFKINGGTTTIESHNIDFVIDKFLEATNGATITWINTNFGGMEMVIQDTSTVEVQWDFQMHLNDFVYDEMNPKKVYVNPLNDASEVTLVVDEEGYATSRLTEVIMKSDDMDFKTPHRIEVNTNDYLYQQIRNQETLELSDSLDFDNDGTANIKEVDDLDSASVVWTKPGTYTFTTNSNGNVLTSQPDGTIMDTYFPLSSGGTNYVQFEAEKYTNKRLPLLVEVFDGMNPLPVYSGNFEIRRSFDWYSTPIISFTNDFVRVKITDPVGEVVTIRNVFIADDSVAPGQISDPLTADTDRDGIEDTLETRDNTFWFEAENYAKNPSTSVIDDIEARNSKAIVSSDLDAIPVSLSTGAYKLHVRAGIREDPLYDTFDTMDYAKWSTSGHALAKSGYFEITDNAYMQSVQTMPYKVIEFDYLINDQFSEDETAFKVKLGPNEIIIGDSTQGGTIPYQEFGTWYTIRIEQDPIADKITFFRIDRSGTRTPLETFDDSTLNYNLKITTVTTTDTLLMNIDNVCRYSKIDGTSNDLTIDIRESGGGASIFTGELPRLSYTDSEYTWNILEFNVETTNDYDLIITEPDNVAYVDKLALVKQNEVYYTYNTPYQLPVANPANNPVHNIPAGEVTKAQMQVNVHSPTPVPVKTPVAGFTISDLVLSEKYGLVETKATDDSSFTLEYFELSTPATLIHLHTGTASHNPAISEDFFAYRKVDAESDAIAVYDAFNSLEYEMPGSSGGDLPDIEEDLVAWVEGSDLNIFDIDQEDDGFIDNMEVLPPEANGIDDDGDGFIDDLPGDPAGTPEIQNILEQNGIDDDGDGYIDDDPTHPAGIPETEIDPSELFDIKMINGILGAPQIVDGKVYFRDSNNKLTVYDTSYLATIYSADILTTFGNFNMGQRNDYTEVLKTSDNYDLTCIGDFFIFNNLIYLPGGSIYQIGSRVMTGGPGSPNNILGLYGNRVLYEESGNLKVAPVYTIATDANPTPIDVMASFSGTAASLSNEKILYFDGTSANLYYNDLEILTGTEILWETDGLFFEDLWIGEFSDEFNALSDSIQFDINTPTSSKLDIKGIEVEVEYIADPIDKDTDGDYLNDGREARGMFGSEVIEFEDAIEFQEWRDPYVDYKDDLQFGPKYDFGELPFIHQTGVILTSSNDLMGVDGVRDSWVRFPIGPVEETGTHRIKLNPPTTQEAVEVKMISESVFEAKGENSYMPKARYTPVDVKLDGETVEYLQEVVKDCLSISIVGSDGTKLDCTTGDYEVVIQDVQLNYDPNGNGLYDADGFKRALVMADMGFTGEFDLIEYNYYIIEVSLDMDTFGSRPVPINTQELFDTVGFIRILNLDRVRVESRGLDIFNDDTDSDNLKDAYEAYDHGYPKSNDPDKDGLTDWQEIIVYGTDPEYRDSDYDGIRDGVEVGLKKSESATTSSFGSFTERLCRWGDPYNFDPIDNWDHDWDEYGAGTFNPTDPNNKDHDGDGLVDGWRDGYMYMFNDIDKADLKSFHSFTDMFKDVPAWQYDESHWGDSGIIDNAISIFEGEDFNCNGKFDNTIGDSYTHNGWNFREDDKRRNIWDSSTGVDEWTETNANSIDSEATGDGVPDGYEVLYGSMDPLKADDGEYYLNPLRNDNGRDKEAGVGLFTIDETPDIDYVINGNDGNYDVIARAQQIKFAPGTAGDLSKIDSIIVNVDKGDISSFAFEIWTVEKDSGNAKPGQMLVPLHTSLSTGDGRYSFEVPDDAFYDLGTVQKDNDQIPYLYFVIRVNDGSGPFYIKGDLHSQNPAEFQPMTDKPKSFIKVGTDWIYEPGYYLDFELILEGSNPGDGLTNYEEYMLGINPKSGNTDHSGLNAISPTDIDATGLIVAGDGLADGVEAGINTGDRTLNNQVFFTTVEDGAYTFEHYGEDSGAYVEYDWDGPVGASQGYRYDFVKTVTDPRFGIDGCVDVENKGIFTLEDGTKMSWNPDMDEFYVFQSDFIPNFGWGNFEMSPAGGNLPEFGDVVTGTFHVFRTDGTEEQSIGDAITGDRNSRLFVTGLTKADTDNDGISDGVELSFGLNDYENDLMYNTRDPDSDNDGVSDGNEIYSLPVWIDPDQFIYLPTIEIPSSILGISTDDGRENDEYAMFNDDCDNDGLLDGYENIKPANRLRTYYPLCPDSDRDGIADGKIQDKLWNPINEQFETLSEYESFFESTYGYSWTTLPTTPELFGEATKVGENPEFRSMPYDEDSDDDGLVDGLDLYDDSVFAGVDHIEALGELYVLGLPFSGGQVDGTSNPLDFSYERKYNEMTDPQKVDTDGDGRSDYLEINTIFEDTTKITITKWDGTEETYSVDSNPRNIDSDGDNLPDGYELGYFADGNSIGICLPSDPNKVDTDGDGMSDDQESILLSPSKTLAASADTDNDKIPDYTMNYNGVGGIEFGDKDGIAGIDICEIGEDMIHSIVDSSRDKGSISFNSYYGGEMSDFEELEHTWVYSQNSVISLPTVPTGPITDHWPDFDTNGFSDIDNDGDGILNTDDHDSDDDGRADDDEEYGDGSSITISHWLKPDSDGDGLFDGAEGITIFMTSGQQLANPLADDDGDGKFNSMDKYSHSTLNIMDNNLVFVSFRTNAKRLDWLSSFDYSSGYYIALPDMENGYTDIGSYSGTPPVYSGNYALKLFKFNGITDDIGTATQLTTIYEGNPVNVYTPEGYSIYYNTKEGNYLAYIRVSGLYIEFKESTDTLPTTNFLSIRCQQNYVKNHAESYDQRMLTDIDFDNDHLPDSYEEANGLDPELPDTDGDGLIDSNIFENSKNAAGVLRGTLPDSDGDGLSDGPKIVDGKLVGEDLNRNGKYDKGTGETDPRTTDTDGDGLWDGKNILDASFQIMYYGEESLGTDPNRLDSDDDGVLDYLEVFPRLSKTIVIDGDSHTFSLPQSYYVFENPEDYKVIDQDDEEDMLFSVGTVILDPANPDSDGDGLPDGFELGIDAYSEDAVALGTKITNNIFWQFDNDFITDPSNPDSDGDSIPDGGIDGKYGEKNGWIDYDEGEGLYGSGNILRNSAFHSRVTIDTDGDGISDKLEVLGWSYDATNGIYEDHEGYKTDPFNIDSDGDGLIDGLSLPVINIASFNRYGNVVIGNNIRQIKEDINPGDGGLLFSDFRLKYMGELDCSSDEDTQTIFELDPTLGDTDGDGFTDGMELSGRIEGIEDVVIDPWRSTFTITRDKIAMNPESINNNFISQKATNLVNGPHLRVSDSIDVDKEVADSIHYASISGEIKTLDRIVSLSIDMDIVENDQGSSKTYDRTGYYILTKPDEQSADPDDLTVVSNGDAFGDKLTFEYDSESDTISFNLENYNLWTGIDDSYAPGIPIVENIGGDPDIGELIINIVAKNDENGMEMKYQKEFKIDTEFNIFKETFMYITGQSWENFKEEALAWISEILEYIDEYILQPLANEFYSLANNFWIMCKRMLLEMIVNVIIEEEEWYNDLGSTFSNFFYDYVYSYIEKIDFNNFWIESLLNLVGLDASDINNPENREKLGNYANEQVEKLFAKEAKEEAQPEDGKIKQSVKKLTGALDKIIDVPSGIKDFVDDPALFFQDLIFSSEEGVPLQVLDGAKRNALVRTGWGLETQTEAYDIFDASAYDVDNFKSIKDLLVYYERDAKTVQLMPLLGLIYNLIDTNLNVEFTDDPWSGTEESGFDSIDPASFENILIKRTLDLVDHLDQMLILPFKSAAYMVISSLLLIIENEFISDNTYFIVPISFERDNGEVVNLDYCIKGMEMKLLLTTFSFNLQVKTIINALQYFDTDTYEDMLKLINKAGPDAKKITKQKLIVGAIVDLAAAIFALLMAPHYIYTVLDRSERFYDQFSDKGGNGMLTYEEKMIYKISVVDDFDIEDTYELNYWDGSLDLMGPDSDGDGILDAEELAPHLVDVADLTGWEKTDLYLLHDWDGDGEWEPAVTEYGRAIPDEEYWPNIDQSQTYASFWSQWKTGSDYVDKFGGENEYISSEYHDIDYYLDENEKRIDIFNKPLDPMTFDTDGDGLSDGEELTDNNLQPNRFDAHGNQIGLWPSERNYDFSGYTNPLNPDSDGDTWTDGREVELGTNPSDSEDHP